jgi:hypothetical protein
MKTLTKTTTHIAKARYENDNVMLRVCELLDWTQEQYCIHQYEAYEAFLARLFGDNPKVYNALRHSEFFRGFWINEWNFRTKRDFLSFAEMSDSETIVRLDGSLGSQEIDLSSDTDEYLFIHNAPVLMGNSDFLTQLYQIINIIFKYGK